MHLEHAFVEVFFIIVTVLTLKPKEFLLMALDFFLFWNGIDVICIVNPAVFCNFSIVIKLIDLALELFKVYDSVLAIKRIEIVLLLCVP